MFPFLSSVVLKKKGCFNMTDRFSKQFESACFEGASFYLVEQQRQDEHYAQISRQLSELMHTIEQKLGEDGKLVYRLEEIINQQAAMNDRWLHRKGAIDCAYLLRWMGLLG